MFALDGSASLNCHRAQCRSLPVLVWRSRELGTLYPMRARDFLSLKPEIDVVGFVHYSLLGWRLVQ